MFERITQEPSEQKTNQHKHTSQDLSSLIRHIFRSRLGFGTSSYSRFIQLPRGVAFPEFFRLVGREASQLNGLDDRAFQQ